MNKFLGLFGQDKFNMKHHRAWQNLQEMMREIFGLSFWRKNNAKKKVWRYFGREKLPRKFLGKINSKRYFQQQKLSTNKIFSASKTLDQHFQAILEKFPKKIDGWASSWRHFQLEKLLKKFFAKKILPKKNCTRNVWTIVQGIFGRGKLWKNLSRRKYQGGLLRAKNCAVNWISEQKYLNRFSNEKKPQKILWAWEVSWANFRTVK